MSRQPHEIFSEAMDRVETAFTGRSVVSIPVRSAKPQPLAQVEVLLTFHPLLQSGGPRNVTIPAGARHEWLTVDVFGHIAKGELSGKPVVEDMWMASGGKDVTELLEPLADVIASYIANN